MWFDKPRAWLEKHTLCKVLVLCAGTLLFLGAAYVVYYRHSDLWHLWLPTSIYNDEVMYNRQVAGILAGGQPRSNAASYTYLSICRILGSTFKIT